jgi:diaminopimelate decarboxylase
MGEAPVHGEGAHSHLMGFQYNGKLRAPELLLCERPTGTGAGAGAAVLDVIREREAVKCLYDNAVMPRDLAEGRRASRI